MDKEGIQTDGPKNKETDGDAQSLHTRDNIVKLCGWRKERGRGFRGCKISGTRGIYIKKRAKKNWLQQPVTVISTEITQRQTVKQQNLKKQEYEEKQL